MRDTLFILRAPFEDQDAMWFCASCAMMEGALLANPHWGESIEVRRMPYPRPRQEMISLIGEANQGMPVLVLGEASTASAEAKHYEGRRFLDEPKAITLYLAKTYGGAGPHP